MLTLETPTLNYDEPTPFVEEWVKHEESGFSGFTNFIGTRMTGSNTTAVAENLKRQLMAGNAVARVEVPFGIFEAKVKVVGESSNIAISYQDNKYFMDLLNTEEDYQQMSIDKAHSKLVQDWLAYGYFDADTRPDLPAKEKGARIDIDEVEYFIHDMAKVMAIMAKDHQRDGKEFRLHLIEEFDFGVFTFNYEGDEIRPSFEPSKAFKQYLKNDSILSTAVSQEIASGMAAQTNRINEFNTFMGNVKSDMKRFYRDNRVAAAAAAGNTKSSVAKNNDVERDAEGYVLLYRKV